MWGLIAEIEEPKSLGVFYTIKLQMLSVAYPAALCRHSIWLAEPLTSTYKKVVGWSKTE